MTDEPIPPDVFQVCGECGHVYATEADLLAAHNEVAVHFGDQPTAELGSALYFCAACTHDF